MKKINKIKSENRDIKVLLDKLGFIEAQTQLCIVPS